MAGNPSSLLKENERSHGWKISQCGEILGKVYYECVSNILFKNVYTSTLKRKEKSAKWAELILLLQGPWEPATSFILRKAWG